VKSRRVRGVTDHAAIARYYDLTVRHYRFLWDLDRSKALHFGFWGDGVRHFSDALAHQNALLADRLALDAGSTVLDAGCGVGGSAIYLAQRFGCRVVGLTLSDVHYRLALDNARAAGVERRVEFSRRDFHATGCADASVDVVWAVESLCHSHDKAAFLREAARVLKPGGRLIVADYFKRRALAARDDAAMRSWLHGWEVPDVETADSMQALALAAGFGSARLEDVTWRVLPSSRRLLLLACLGWCVIALWRLRGIRKPVSEGNVRGAFHQFFALRRGLALYGVLEATKL
jgi:tocopherol O-methyltransferase